MIDKFSTIKGAKYFFLGIFQNYLAFIPIEYFKIIVCLYQLEITLNIFMVLLKSKSWKSNVMSEESIENITKSNSNFAPTFVDHYSLPDLSFNGHFLIKSNISIPKKVINLYISYTLGPQLRNSSTDFILSNCLFGSR